MGPQGVTALGQESELYPLRSIPNSDLAQAVLDEQTGANPSRMKEGSQLKKVLVMGMRQGSSWPGWPGLKEQPSKPINLQSTGSLDCQVLPSTALTHSEHNCNHLAFGGKLEDWGGSPSSYLPGSLPVTRPPQAVSTAVLFWWHPPQLLRARPQPSQPLGCPSEAKSSVPWLPEITHL